MRHPLWLVLPAALFICGGTPAAERPLYDDVFFKPSAAVVTAHIPWARPYAQERPRVLFITHRNAMREVIEIAQRLEMTHEVFACEAPEKFGETGLGVDSSWKLIRGNSAEELTESLMETLKADYDVIVIGDLKWDILPISCRYEILRKVKAGTGLVGRIRGGYDPYLGKILRTSDFAWNWALWSGAAQGVEDYFGTGVFEGGVDREVTHSGGTSLRIEGKQVTKGSREAARAGYHPGSIQLEPDTEYVFSAWTRTEGLTDGQAQVSLHPLPVALAVPAGDDWVRTEVRFKTTAEVHSTGVYLLNYQVGTVWYDDLSLTRAGDDTNLLPNPSFDVAAEPPAALTDGVPFESLPAFSAAGDVGEFGSSTFQVERFGEGRIGLLKYGPPIHQMMTPGPRGSLRDCRSDYDYYLALAIKLILWGAGAEPPVHLSAPTATVTLDRGQQEPLRWTAGAQSAMAGTTAQVVVRDRLGRPLHEASWPVDIKAGDNPITVELPVLPRGDLIADLWLKSGERVVDFASVGLQVRSATGIGTLALDKDSFSLGEALVGKVAVEGAFEGLSVRLTATDFYGRLVADETVPAAAETAFSLPMPPSLSLAGRLEAELIGAEEIVDRSHCDYTINNLNPDHQDVEFVMWMDYPTDFIGPMMAEEFTRNGIDAQYGGSLGYAPYANQWWLPYATRFVDTKTDWYQPQPTREPGDLVRDPCLTDPEYRESVREKLTTVATTGLRVGTSDFTLGDENHFVAGAWDLCFSDTCVEHFRVWARESYGSLEALNESWGSGFTDWSQVRPQTLKECEETGNYVPWVDHRLHMESVWADIHDFSRQVIKQVVPGARVGYEGSDTHLSSYQAADYWELSRAMDLNNIYYRDFMSLAWYDFAPEGMLYGGGWFGGYPGNRNEPFMRWFPWRTLLKGANSFWVWAGYGHAGAVMAFDVSLYPFFQSACEEVAQIAAGPGKLLATSQRQHDGIALLYSASSLHVGTTTPGFPGLNDTLDAIVRLLHDTGLECRVISYQELAEGKVTVDEFKALILPGAQGLSEAEVAAVASFARSGGHVIADLRPGIANEHGKPYDRPALDELFGITQGPEFEKVTLDSGEIGLGAVPADGSLKTAGGRAATVVQGTPLMVSNQVGQGEALLLNFSLNAYLGLGKGGGGDFAGWEEGAAYRTFLAGLMRRAAVTPTVTIEPAAPYVEVSRFTNGQAEYVGIVQGLPRAAIDYTNKVAPPPAPQDVTIHLGRSAYVYDVRGRRYVGHTDRVKTQLTPGVASLYALMPYPVEQVVVEAPERVEPGAAVPVKLRLKAEEATGDHVLRLEVTGPDQQERAHYSQNILAHQGTAETTLHLALNDDPGRWSIHVTDVATGVATVAQVDVEAGR